MQAGYEYQSKFARKYVAEGEAEGKAEGEAEGKADALLSFLSARKLPATKRERQKILACRDLAQLDRWIAQAASVATVAELFR